MTNSQKYNGWTNYATWCVHLWMSNDDREHTCWVYAAQDVIETCDLKMDLRFYPPSLQWSIALAERIREHHEEMLENTLSDHVNVFHDLLLNAALADVNWREIADSYLEAAHEVANHA